MSAHQTNRPTSKERWKFIFFYGMILSGGTTALMVSVNSPNKFAEQVDVNPVSVAGINISLKNDEVILDYSKAKAESHQDRELLRAMVDCIHMLRDSEGSMELVEVNIQLLGLEKESVLHAELAQCLEARKKAVEKSKE